MSENLLRLPAVMAKTGLSRSGIYAAIRENRFPPSISLGSRAVAWPASDIEKWVAEKIAESRQVA